MSKLRIFYLFTLLILGVLLAFAVFRPMASGEKYSTVSRESIIQEESESIIQFNIINREGKDTKYNVKVLVGDRQYNEEFLIQDGGVYVYIHHIPRSKVSSGQVNITIYKDGEDTPFEQGTYYLR